MATTTDVPLSDWFKSRIESLYVPTQSQSQPPLTTIPPLAPLFDSTFAPSATFSVNGNPVSRQDVMDDMRTLRGGQGGETQVEDETTETAKRLPVIAPGTTSIEWVSVDVTPKRLDEGEVAHASERAGGDGYFVKPEPETGSLSASFILTRSLPFRIRVGPAQRRRVVTTLVSVERVCEPSSGDDGRRIVSYDETSEEGAAPVRLTPAALQV